jgi:transcriptional regulator with XRE-family HTH domain
MSQLPSRWPGSLIEVIAAEIRRVRQARKLSIQQLSDRLAAVGVAIARPVLSNLETGRRPTISVGELFAIASVLEVPPLSLLFPPGRTDRIEVMPGVLAEPGEALTWFEGRLFDDDPLHALGEQSTQTYLEAGDDVERLRRHQLLVQRWATNVRQATLLGKLQQARESAERAGLDDIPGAAESVDMIKQFRATHDAGAESDVELLRSHRKEMTERGLPLPELPAELRVRVEGI